MTADDYSDRARWKAKELLERQLSALMQRDAALAEVARLKSVVSELESWRSSLTESAVLLRAAAEFERLSGEYEPSLSNDSNWIVSDAYARGARRLRHLAHVGFDPRPAQVAAPSPLSFIEPCQENQ